MLLMLQHDHQRSRTDRRQADDKAADHTDEDRRCRLDSDVVHRSDPGVAAAPIEIETHQHGGRPDEHRRTEQLLDVGLGRRGSADDMEEIGAEKGHWHRPGHHPSVSRIPLGRTCQPEEQARVVRFLLSDEVSYVSGVSILVDGGMTSTI
jgi:hypothetical protein